MRAKQTTVSPRDLPKEFQSLALRAREQGWVILHTNSGHYKWLSPLGRGMVFTGSSPSDRRAVANTETKLKQYGFHK